MENDPTKEELDFLYDEDLLPALERVGLKDDFVSGKLRCAICGDIITNDNLLSLFEKNGIKIGCNKADCIRKVKSSNLEQ